MNDYPKSQISTKEIRSHMPRTIGWVVALVLLAVIVGAVAYSAGSQQGITRPTTASGGAATQTLTITQTFSGGGATSTITSTVTVLGSSSQDLVQYCFSPGGHCDQVLVGWISRANSTIHVLIYSFTLDDVRDALISAHNRGLDVKVVMEKENVNEPGSEYYNLKTAGVDVRWDSRSALMHDKFAVIDGHVIVTGSYNWSASATNSNNENMAVIDSSSWGTAYETNFQTVYATAIMG